MPWWDGPRRRLSVRRDRGGDTPRLAAFRGTLISGSWHALVVCIWTPYLYPTQTQPTEITSSPNSSAATLGNNARVRVIIDGSQTGGATGFVLDTSNAMLRGLIIDRFGVGVSVPHPYDVGNLIQG